MTDIPGFKTFEFDLPSALLEQLVEVFDGLTAGPLHAGATRQIPNGQGAYQLFHNGRLVYIGKTDGQAGLRQRFSRHAWTIVGRHNLSVEQMTFKAIQVLVFSAMDLETALIAHYRARRAKPAWNGSGFGSNDPGRRRDTTALRADGFDANYPINIDQVLDENVGTGEISARRALTLLAASVPYTVRWDPNLAKVEALVGLPGPEHQSARSIVKAVVETLPAGWQATKLPGRIILYHETVDTYPGGEIIART